MNDRDPGAAPRRIAFVRLGRVPEAQKPLLEQLRLRFPDHDVDVVDIKEWLSERPDVFVIAALVALVAYAPSLLRRQRRPQDAFFRTRYIVSAIRRLMARRVRPGTHRFSIQMQSLFDASVDGVPHFVYTDHTNLANLQYPTRPAGAVYPASWQALETDFYARATRVLTRSENIRRSVIDDYGIPEERVETVFVGSNVGTAEFDEGLERYAAQRVLFVGRDWRRKGGPDLIEAWRRLRPDFPDARLIIAGTSPIVRDAGVEVLGRVPQARMSSLYASSSIFCMPTHLEPFGVVFVEAMAHALPVVATRVGALPQMVTDDRNGFLVDPGDVDALTDRLRRLLSDAESCRRLGQGSKKVARERYTWDSVGRRIERIVRAQLPS